MYPPELLDHFQNPRNVGEVEHPDAAVSVENPACGDIMRLTVKVVDGRLIEVRYRTKGCVTAIACGSRLTEMLLGRAVTDAAAIRREELVTSLGGLSNETMHASHLAMDALAALLRQLRSAKK